MSLCLACEYSRFTLALFLPARDVSPYRLLKYNSLTESESLQQKGSVGELAWNVYRRQENAAFLALKFLKAGWHSPEYFESQFCEKEQMR